MIWKERSQRGMLLLLGASLRGEKEQNISSQQTSNKIDQSPTFRQIFSKNYSLQNMVISRFSNPPPILTMPGFWKHLILRSLFLLKTVNQGDTSCRSAEAALPERSGSLRKDLHNFKNAFGQLSTKVIVGSCQCGKSKERNLVCSECKRYLVEVVVGPLRLPQVLIKPRKIHSSSSAVLWRRPAKLG